MGRAMFAIPDGRSPQNGRALFYLSALPMLDETLLNDLINFANLYFDAVGEEEAQHGFVGMAHHFLGRYAAARTHYDAATLPARRSSETSLRFGSIYPLFYRR